MSIKPMRRYWIPTFIAVVALSGVVRADAPSQREEISSDRAFELAAYYRLRYIGLCGAAGDPISHAKYWEVPIVVGVGAEPAGSIRVDRHTGIVSYPGHPTPTPKELEAWSKSFGKPKKGGK
jgi:hypothetical protein